MADLREPDRYAYLAEGNAKQARKRVAVKALIVDGEGSVLLVNPTYKPDWDLPGGMVEANESPLGAVQRELREELNLTTSIGRLLLVDWVGPNEPWDDQLVFVFDGGTLGPGQVAGLELCDPELSHFQFVPRTTTADMLRPDMQQALNRAHEALANGTTSYGERDRHW